MILSLPCPSVWSSYRCKACIFSRCTFGRVRTSYGLAERKNPFHNSFARSIYCSLRRWNDGRRRWERKPPINFPSRVIVAIICPWSGLNEYNIMCSRFRKPCRTTASRVYTQRAYNVGRRDSGRLTVVYVMQRRLSECFTRFLRPRFSSSAGSVWLGTGRDSSGLARVTQQCVVGV